MKGTISGAYEVSIIEVHNAANSSESDAVSTSLLL